MTLDSLHLQYEPDFPRLDLGCGAEPREGFIGVDRTWRYHVLGWDLTVTPWPWEDESIEALHSSHLIEHLPLQDRNGCDALVRFFEEAWRICKDNALFHLRWPAPFHPETGAIVPSAWWDPTHYRHIPHQQIPAYFSAAGRASMGVESYGIRCNWVPTGNIAWRNLTDDGAVVEYVIDLRREPL